MNKRGFTMVEVAIVLVIMGTVTALALPTMHGALQKTNVRSTRVAFSALLARARSTAVQRGCTATLWFTTGSAGKVWVTACKTTGSGTDTVGTIEPLAVRYGTTMTSSSSSVAYDPRGITVGYTSAKVVFTAASGDQDSTMINQLGQVVH